MGSFFKMLLVVVCCGFIVVCGDWIEWLVDLKIVISFGGGCLVVDILYIVLIDSGYCCYVEFICICLVVVCEYILVWLVVLGICFWLVL